MPADLGKSGQPVDHRHAWVVAPKARACLILAQGRHARLCVVPVGNLCESPGKRDFQGELAAHNDWVRGQRGCWPGCPM